MALEPITREEIFMAKAGGQNVETPEPITRKEQFLAAIAGNGGSGGGGSTEPSYEVILPEQTIHEDSVGTGRTTLFNKAIGFIEGETYRITFNGEEYVLEAYVSLAEGQVPICGAGNAAFIGGEDTGEPFGVADIVSPQMTACGISWNTGEESITLKVEKLVSTGQPDYLQNDPTAKDYIKNRPFYEGLSVLLPETTLTFTNSQYAGNLGLNFEEGETYTIVWDGIEYECKAFYFDNGTVHGNVLGNLAAVGGTNTGEPFFIGTAAGGDGYTMAACLTGATSATLKVLGKTLKKIDEKYLPAAVGIMYLDVEYVADGTGVDYNTFFEVRDHMLNNGMVIMRIHENNAVYWCYPSDLITDPDVLAQYEGAVFIASFWSINEGKRAMLTATQQACSVSFFGF